MYENNLIKGLVLEIREKNQNDVIIKIMTQSSFVYLLAKGFNNADSKNRSNVLIGSFSIFEVFFEYGKNNFFLLKKAHLDCVLDFANRNNQFFVKRLFYLFSLIEKPNSIIFEVYYKFLSKGNYLEQNYFLVYLFNLVLQTKGLYLNNIQCSICRSNQNLFCINLFEGGMLCKQHSFGFKKTRIDYLKAFYYLGSSYELFLNNSTEEINLFFWKMFMNFIY